MLTMLDAVDRAINADRSGVNMTNEEILDVFGDFDPSEHAAETEERWGDSDAYRESAGRTASYTKEEWEELGREADGINAAFLELMAAGAPAADDDSRCPRRPSSRPHFEMVLRVHPRDPCRVGPDVHR